MVVDPENISALINIRGEQAIYTPEAVYIPLERAKEGLEFGFQAQSDVFWQLGDGNTIQTAPGKKFQHAYNDPGIYVVIAVGINSFGQKVIQAKAVVVAGDFAEFKVSSTSPEVGTGIVFDASLSTQKAQLTGGVVTEYNWTCEGGAGCFGPATGERISANFQVPGTYAITLQIETSTGQKDYSTQEVFIKSDMPFADFKAKPAFGPQNAGTYFLDASFSTSRLGKKEGLTYRWNINGKEILTQEPVLTHSFARAGEQEISLVVEESEFIGESEVATEVITVDSILAVDFILPKEVVRLGESLDFEARSPNALRYLWEFPGDKKVRTQNASHRFQENGRQAISLEVSAGESVNQVKKIIQVRNTTTPTAFVEILVNGIEVNSRDISIEKGDLLTIRSVNVDRYGEEQNDFKETWLVNSEVISKRDIATSFQEFGEYEVKYVIIDPYDPNQRDEQVFIFSVGNTAPRIGTVDVSTPQELPAGSVRLTVQAADKEREAMSYVFKAFSYTEEITNQKSDNNEIILTLPNGVYDFEVEVIDASGQKSSKFLDLDYVITKVVNDAPTGVITSDPASLIFTTTEVIFRAVAEDPDKDGLFFDWQIDGVSIQAGENNIFRYTFERPGNYEVLALVDDQRGGKVTLTKNVSVGWDPSVRTRESNTAPTITLCAEGGEHVSENQRVTIQGNAYDKDGEALAYNWSVNGVENISNLPNLGYEFEQPGQYSIKLSVTDLFVTTTEEFVITAHPNDVIRPYGSMACSQLLSSDDFYGNTGDEVSIISTTGGPKNFIDQIYWISSQQEEVILAPQNLKDLHDWGRVGIRSISAPLESLLAHRQQVLLQLKNKTSNEQIKEKINEEIVLLQTTPAESLQGYLDLLRPGVDTFKYARHLDVGESLFLAAKSPEDILAPLSFSWDLGDGSVLSGKNPVLVYNDPGFYLVTLTISDGLTPVQDSIIIQVDPRS